MTKLLDKALAAVRKLPSNAQDEIAQTILDLAARNGDPEAIEPADLPAVLEGLAQARPRKFASEEEIEAAFRRFDS